MEKKDTMSSLGLVKLEVRAEKHYQIVVVAYGVASCAYVGFDIASFAYSLSMHLNEEEAGMPYYDEVASVASSWDGGDD